MMLKNKPKKARLIKTIILSFAFIVLLLFLSSYLLIKSYINKMNLVTSSKESITMQIKDLDMKLKMLADAEKKIESEQQENDSDTPKSTEEEIASLEEKIRNNMEGKSTPILYDEDVLNILLIGSDSRIKGELGRSDVIIIVSINEKSKSIIATSILRDIYLQIPGCSNNRINAAYAYGGADLLMEAIEQNFKIKIDRYVSIDFYAFMDVVDAVGGVTLDVTKEEIPVINEYVKQLNELTDQEEGTDYMQLPGKLLLNGKQALSYARNRYVGNADFERTARQRRVLEQIFINVKEQGLLELNDLLNRILPQITTNLTEGEIFSLILSLPSYKGYELKQWSIPVDGAYSFMNIRGMAVLGIDFDKNIQEIHNRIYAAK